MECDSPGKCNCMICKFKSELTISQVMEVYDTWINRKYQYRDTPDQFRRDFLDMLIEVHLGR